MVDEVLNRILFFTKPMKTIHFKDQSLKNLAPEIMLIVEGVSSKLVQKHRWRCQQEIARLVLNILDFIQISKIRY